MALKKRSVAIELRLRAEAEARKEAAQKLKQIMVRFATGTLTLTTLLALVAFDVLAIAEPVIEEVRGSAQLEKILADKDFVAVLWNARNCRPCEIALKQLETIDDDAEKFSVDFVKVINKRLAKQYHVQTFPTLTMFRDGEMTPFIGDLTNAAQVLEFLTSEDTLTLPDKIEEVNSHLLMKIIEEEKFVTALFFDESQTSNDVLTELENIDDEADVFEIRFVRIQDEKLAEDFSLEAIPSLVYFRGGIPIVYQGDLTDEAEVLEWLIQQQSTVGDEDIVESVDNNELDIMMRNVDYLLVLYHDRKKRSQKALNALEHIDDDCDEIGISFVEVDKVDIARHHGVEDFPTLVFYKSEIPAVYEDDLTDGEEVMEWVISLVEGADIEEVTDDMLEKMIVKAEKLSVLFYEENDEESTQVLALLEEIDDDLDELDVLLVKINEATVASDFGIEDRPTLVIFEKGIPNVYQGNLHQSQEVLEWIIGEISGDHTVEVVTDAMLDRMIATFPHVAAFFYDKDGHEKSDRALEALETIDDDIQEHSEIKLVKIDDPEEALEYGLKQLPSLVFFENQMPNMFDGNLENSKQVLTWIIEIAMQDKIELVSGAMLEKLVEEKTNLAVFVHDKFAHDKNALLDLETIDDDLDRLGVHMVRLEDQNGEYADKYELDVVPCLVLFHEKRPRVFKGQISDEKEAIKWFREIVASFED